jgi:hypothetical protein
MTVDSFLELLIATLGGRRRSAGAQLVVARQGHHIDLLEGDSRQTGEDIGRADQAGRAKQCECVSVYIQDSCGYD